MSNRPLPAISMHGPRVVRVKLQEQVRLTPSPPETSSDESTTRDANLPLPVAEYCTSGEIARRVPAALIPSEGARQKVYSTPPRTPRGPLTTPSTPSTGLPPSSPLPPVPQSLISKASSDSLGLLSPSRLEKARSFGDFPLPPSTGVHESDGSLDRPRTPSSSHRSSKIRSEPQQQIVTPALSPARVPSEKPYRKSRIQYPKSKQQELAVYPPEADESDISAEHQWTTSLNNKLSPNSWPPSSDKEPTELPTVPGQPYDKLHKERYRSFDDLSRFPIQHQIPGKSSLAHLPDWNPQGGKGRSALPNNHIQRNMDYTMRKLMNENVFKELILDPLGRHRFREFMKDPSDLDLWADTSQVARTIQEWKTNAEALHDLYLVRDSENSVDLPSEIQRELILSLRSIVSLDTSFDSTQRYLLYKMYNDQFQDFVKHKIVQEMHVKLGKHNLSQQDQEGLGDCFCLTDPRITDHPIVLASEGFIAVTGYPKSQIVGRNCRFLQGPGTSPGSVQRIRDGLNSGEGCTELVLNYRRNGEPFYCLLCIIPLRDTTGAIAYFIGGQTNVTGILANHKNLGFLIGGDAGVAIHNKNPDLLSPAMMMYKQAQAGLLSDTLTTKSGKSGTAASRREPGAAGSSDTQRIQQNLDFLGTDLGGLTHPRGNIMSRLFTRTGKKSGTERNQILSTGTEAILAGDARPLEDQFTLFQDTYSKLIVFKKEKREIMFVTPRMLKYLGLPCATATDLYSSPLVHCDVVTFLTVGDKAETKQMHKEFKGAIKANESISIMCGFKYMSKGKNFGRKDHTEDKFCVMHVTPLLNRDSVNVAFVAIFA